MEMMKMINKTGMIAILIFLSVLSNGITQDVENNLVNPQDALKLSAGSEAFALDLFKRISSAVAPVAYNFMISPFTIWSLLILTTEGADGNTLEELRRVLRIKDDLRFVRESYKQIQKSLNVNTPTVEVSVAQAMFYDMESPVENVYQRVIEGTYSANLLSVNFTDRARAKQQINSYVNGATKGLIDYLVNEEDLTYAKMILVSTIFFKGQWKFPFNRTLTKEEPFYDEEGNVKGNVNMMFQRGAFQYTPIAALDSHILELPYGKEDRLSMIILLPRKGVTLTAVTEKLAAYGLGNLFHELKKTKEDFEDDEVEVYLPRFTTTTDFVLNIILEQMGIIDLFSEKANLSKMSKGDLYLSRLFHKTKIEVTEEGTVASAATGGIFANKATPPRFYINKPFAYIIIEKTTNSLLFCGQVRDPAKFRL